MGNIISLSIGQNTGNGGFQKLDPMIAIRDQLHQGVILLQETGHSRHHGRANEGNNFGGMVGLYDQIPNGQGKSVEVVDINTIVDKSDHDRIKGFAFRGSDGNNYVQKYYGSGNSSGISANVKIFSFGQGNAAFGPIQATAAILDDSDQPDILQNYEHLSTAAFPGRPTIDHMPDGQLDPAFHTAEYFNTVQHASPNHHKNQAVSQHITPKMAKELAMRKFMEQEFATKLGEFAPTPKIRYERDGITHEVAALPPMVGTIIAIDEKQIYHKGQHGTITKIDRMDILGRSKNPEALSSKLHQALTTGQRISMSSHNGEIAMVHAPEPARTVDYSPAPARAVGRDRGFGYDF